MSWSKTYSTVSKEVNKAQMWSLFSQVNNWHTWDDGIEFAKMEGAFAKGNRFKLRPKGGPTVDIELIEAVPEQKFTDLTKFPLATMTGEHLLEDTAEGLRITTTMTVKGILGFLWVKLVAQNIVNNLAKDTANQIKAASKL